MNKKLLKVSKNLIITFLIVFFMITTLLTVNVFADPDPSAVSPTATQNFTDQMKGAIGGWYFFIRNICIIVLAIGFIVMLLKALTDRTPEAMTTLKKSLKDWIISLALVFFLHFAMIAIIKFNQTFIDLAKGLAGQMSGLNDKDVNEYVLYDAALSKAYEIAIVPGFIGLIMYILLVYYTFKFVIFYLKRYINVIVLIILGPLVCTVSCFKKATTGITGGMIGKWFKEFIYNVFIQAFHAFFYAVVIGLTIKLSQDTQNYAAAILTMILFGAIFQIDKMLRKLFNFVGGSTSISTMSSRMDDADARLARGGQALSHAAGAVSARAQSLKGLTFKEKAGAIAKLTAKDAVKVKKDFTDTFIDAKKVKVTAKEIVEQEEKTKENKGFEKVRNISQKAMAGVGGGLAFGIEKTTKRVDKAIKNIKEKHNKKVKELKNEIEMIKRIPIIIKAATRKKMPEKYTAHGLSDLYMATIDVDKKPDRVVNEVKNGIQNESSDVLSIVYFSVGVQAFLYSKIGSPRMGMALLAENNYDNQAIRELNGEEINQGARRTLRHSSNISSSNFARTYQFGRFNYSATRRIVKKLERKAIINTPYLRVIDNISNKMGQGNVGVRGTVQVNNVNLTYKAKANSAKTRKQNATLKLEKIASRVEDGKWAQISSKMLDSRSQVNSLRANLSRREVNSQAQVMISNMVRAGEAYTISDDVTLVKKTATATSNAEVASVTRMTDSSTSEVASVTRMTDSATSEVASSTRTSEIQTSSNIFEKSNEALLSQITDNVIVDTAIQVEEYDLKHLSFTTNEQASRIAINGLISNGVIKESVTENMDELNEVVESLDTRTEEISVQHEDKVFERLAELEYANIVKESINSGEVTPDNIEDINLEKRTQKLSAAIIQAAKEQMERADQKVDEIIEEIKEDRAIAKEERELEKARKELQKGKAKKDEKDEEGKEDDEPLEKINLRFYGAIEGGYASVTLTNKHRLKDFYYMANPIEGVADLSKTEQYFNEKYGPKLNIPFFYFKYNAQPIMDGWEVHVAGKTEDVTGGDKEKDEELEKEAVALEQRFRNNLPEIKTIFEKFVEENYITSFEEITDNQQLKRDLISKISWGTRKEHFSTDEISNFVDTMEDYSDLRNVVKDRLAKTLAKKRVIEQRDKFVVEKTKVDSGKSATKEETSVPEESDKTIIVDASALQVIQDLLGSLDERKVLVGTKQGDAREKIYRHIMEGYEN